MARRRLASPIRVVGSAFDVADGMVRARLDHRNVRVANALPGERVDARPLGKRRGYWRALAVSVDGALHPLRAEPPCTHFPDCGGCQLQHVRYEEQLRLKLQRLMDLLECAGVATPAPDVWIEGPTHGYRRKARLGVWGRSGPVRLGFRTTFTRRISDAQHCSILEADIVRCLEPLRQTIEQLSIRASVPQIEVALGNDGPVFVLRALEKPSIADCALLQDQGERMGGLVGWQTGGYSTVAAPFGQPLALLEYDLVELETRFHFHAADFVQVNASVNRTLQQLLYRLAVDRDLEYVADLFCGIGNFSLPLARAGCRVAGFELAGAAVERARLNAYANGLGRRTQFERLDLYHQPPPDDADRYDAVVIDPPRSGAGALIDAWLGRRVHTLVYVSCDPESFAKDAKRLCALGFRLESVRAADMFPHTTHFETLAVFGR